LEKWVRRNRRVKLVDESELPPVRLTTKDWIEILKKIPPGKAWAIDPKEDGVNPSNAKAMVNYLIRKHKIGRNYRVISKMEGEILAVYILNSSRRFP
jgi:hypothetical protein